MTPTPTLYHALLRPCILQTLRATGYHSIRPSTLDAFTDLAARYLFAVCRSTALHAVDNYNEGRDPADPYDDGEDDGPGLPPVSIVDVRMALEGVGAFGVVERFIEPDEPHGQPAQQGQNGTRTTESGSRDTAGDARGRYNPDDDTRGVDEFVAWFAGAKCRAIRDMVTAGFGDGVVPAGTAVNEGEVASGDYLHGESHPSDVLTDSC
jgi:transcription initiation factor TFIID subunit 3